MPVGISIIIEAVDRASDDIKALNKDLAKTGKSLDEASKKTKSHGKSLEALKKNYKAVSVGVVAAGIAIKKAIDLAKKAFDMAKLGAGIKQTEESFDSLTDRVNLSIDVMGAMKEATRGTVDEMTMMKSVLTLTAGATGSTERALTAVMPQLAKIAKAANKLNPTLGTTAFQMESLATAAKRQSIMIADNAGLIIRMDNAVKAVHPGLQTLTNDYAGLTQQQRFLNEMLWQGDNLIEQVGGTVDSATDAFEAFEANMKNAGDAAKENMSGLGQLLQIYNDMVVEGEKVSNTIYAIQAALDAGLIQQYLYNKLMADFGQGHVEAAETIEILNKAIEESMHRQEQRSNLFLYTMTEEEKAWYRLSLALSEYGQNIYYASEGTQFYATKVEALENSLNPTVLSLSKFRDHVNEAFEATADAAAETQKFNSQLKRLNEIDINIGSKIAADLEKIEYKDFGYDAIQARYDLIQARLAAPDGAYTIEMGKVELTELYIAEQAILTSQGKITKWEAAQTLTDALGLPDAMGTLEEALAIIDKFGQDYYMTVTVDVYYPHGRPPGAGGTQEGESAKPTQFGGPVTAGGSYLVGEVGPELFVPNVGGTIIPNDKMGEIGDTTNYNFDVTVMVEGGDPNAIIAALNEQARYAKISGQAYSGH